MRKSIGRSILTRNAIPSAFSDFVAALRARVTTGPDSPGVDPAHWEQWSSWLGGYELDSLDDLDLGTSAKAAAKNLLRQFPDIKFTCGRRSISDQASAMATNVLMNRKWIEQTYKETPQRADLQKWIDDHPEATTIDAIERGLNIVMNGWTEAQQRNFSRHMTGDAFDVQPMGGSRGEEIKEAIAALPRLQWHTFKEGGLEIWHAQFHA